MLPRYVSRLRQFIFDGEGRLVSTSVLTGDEVSGWKGTLPDGTYTVVLWGNLSDADPPPEKVESGGGAAEGETGDMLEAMTLSAVSEGVPPGYRGNTSRLYYGTGTFTLKDGMTERPADLPLPGLRLAHDYCALADHGASPASCRRRLPDAPERHSVGLRLLRRTGGDGTFG